MGLKTAFSEFAILGLYHFPDATKMVSPQGGQQQFATELATHLATEHATSDFSSSPASIAKSIVHDLYIEISKLTNELYDVGESNDDASCAKRVDIMNERAGLIERYNRVYDAKELFFAGEISEKELDDTDYKLYIEGDRWPVDEEYLQESWKKLFPYLEDYFALGYECYFIENEKNILNNLTNVIKSKEKAREILSKLNVDTNKRPEELDINFYISLLKELNF